MDSKCPEYLGNEFFFITPGDMHQGKHIHACNTNIKGNKDAKSRLGCAQELSCVDSTHTIVPNV